ncbi:hypothetical protein ACP4OV_016242 [Aristida adscensionis]
MSNHHRFRLSHLMPNSWFYKLRDMKRPRPTSQRNTETTRTSMRSSRDYYHGTTTPKPLPLSPRRSSYPYLNTNRISLEKLQPSSLHINPKASDIQFPKDHQHHHHHHHQLSTSRTAAVVIGAEHDEFQELQLHPIRTRPAPTGSSRVHSESGTCPSSPRIRSRRLHVLSGCRVSTATAATGRRRSTAGRSLAIVMKSTDPSRDFRESMLEMIVENNLCAQEDFQDLLECYLSLNSPVYHGVIMEVFRGILLDIMFDNVEV